MDDNFNLAEYVLKSGADQPGKTALAIIDSARAERWSYARLIAAVRGTATGFMQAGLAPGDYVLLRLGNRPAFPVAYLGAIAAGLLPVPTSAQLTPREITRIAHEINPALIVAGEGIALPDHPAPILAEQQLSRFEALPPCDWHRGSADRPAYVIYTSGTSGQPRAVVHAHRAILARRMMFDGWYGLRPSDRLLHAGAFNWTFTLGTGLMDPWTLGATSLIPRENISPAQLPLLARRHGATIIAAAPGVYRQMLREPWPVWDGLRHGLSAGERLAPQLRNAWHDRTGTDLHEAMGMSECSTFLSGNPTRPAPADTAGYPQSGRQIAILGEDDQPLPAGQAGRLAVHRNDPGLFLGYLDQPEETRSRFRGDWFVTGDMASQDCEGAISILGRDDDMMNAGGFRLAPAEIEDFLALTPNAGEVAAASIKVSDSNSVIALFWTGTASADQLKAAAEAGLARYKQPREYIRVAQLPRTPTGKINRRALRDTHSKDC